ncbi:MAG: hypothetical protein Q9159_002648 [Coniocarpon cinnabarinum]
MPTKPDQIKGLAKDFYDFGDSIFHRNLDRINAGRIDKNLMFVPADVDLSLAELIHQASQSLHRSLSNLRLVDKLPKENVSIHVPSLRKHYESLGTNDAINLAELPISGTVALGSLWDIARKDGVVHREGRKQEFRDLLTKLLVVLSTIKVE